MICDYIETQQFILDWPSDFLIRSHTHTHTYPLFHRSIVHQIVDRRTDKEIGHNLIFRYTGSIQCLKKIHSTPVIHKKTLQEAVKVYIYKHLHSHV